MVHGILDLFCRSRLKLACSRLEMCHGAMLADENMVTRS
jgi:hypothetical protein